jgi:uncharacterized protein involved in exopolysaccharide biosynthesis
LILLAAMLFVVFSARYESHFMVLLRRGRYDPVLSSQPPSPMDFTRPDITEEELNSEVELLRDPDLLRQVVTQAGLIPAGTSPEQAARVLSALSTLYLQRHASLQRPPGGNQFFDQQTAEYVRRLRHSESELVRFTRARGVASAALERDIALQKLGEADAAYRQIDQDRVETERRIASLSEQLKSFPSRSVTLKRWADNPEALEKMKTHLLDLQLKRTEMLSRFEPSYRLVQEVENEIADTQASITAEALTPVRDETTDKDPNYEWARMELEKAQVQWDGLRSRQSDAAGQVASLRQIAQHLQSDSVEQQDLMRTAKTDEDNYLLYLHKREEARISDALDARRILNVAIVEPPVAPALPVHNILLYFALAFALSVAFSIATAFTVEYLDPTIRTPGEAYGLMDAPVLAWLPAHEPKVERPFISQIGRSRTVIS